MEPRLTTLLVLDRLQSANRFVNVTDFVDNAGETPGTLAASNGCNAACGALEASTSGTRLKPQVFGDMQLNAEQLYFGQSTKGEQLGADLSLE